MKRYGLALLLGSMVTWLFFMAPSDGEAFDDSEVPELAEVIDLSHAKEVAVGSSSSVNDLVSDEVHLESEYVVPAGVDVSEDDRAESESFQASSVSIWLYPEDHAPRLIQVVTPDPGRVPVTGCEYGRNTAWRAAREEREEPWATEMEFMLKTLWNEQQKTPVDSSLMIYCGSTVCQVSHAYTENGYPHQYIGPYLRLFRDSPLASEFMIKAMGGMDRRQMLLLRRSGKGLQEGEPEHCIEGGRDLQGGIGLNVSAS